MMCGLDTTCMFNRCHSGLKALEAAWSGVRVNYSERETLRVIN